jgi:aspartate kinase
MLLAYGFLSKVFEIFKKYKTPIDMITTSEVAVSLTIDEDKHLARIIDELQDFGEVIIDKEQSIICMVGNEIVQEKGIVQKIFDALVDIPIRMISYGGSKYNISIVTETRYKKDALIALNKGLFDL